MLAQATVLRRDCCKVTAQGVQIQVKGNARNFTFHVVVVGRIDPQVHQMKTLQPLPQR